LESIGGGTKEMAAFQPPESIRDNPWHDPDMFGSIPASGFFLRHINNVEFTNVEIAFTRPDARTVFWMDHVDDVELFHVKTPRVLSAPEFALHDVRNFRTLACRNVEDMDLKAVEQKEI
jgi:hypothetical protein